MIDPNKVMQDAEQADRIMQRQRAEIARLRLTPEEREAVFAAWCDYSHGVKMKHKPTEKEIAAGLHGLLERHKEGEHVE